MAYMIKIPNYIKNGKNRFLFGLIVFHTGLV
jgi:hypothetical protein